jgi:hypothetical protein
MDRFAPALILAGLTAAAAHAAGPVLPKPGTYEIAVFAPNTGWDTYGLLKIAPQGDGVAGSMIATHPQIRGISLKSVAVEGDRIRVVITAPPLGGDRTFEFRVPKEGDDTILGTFDFGRGPNPARMSITDKTALTMRNFRTRPDVPEPMQKLEALSTNLAELRRRAVEEKGKLAKEVADAEHDYHVQMPNLLREVAERYPDNPATILSAQGLLRQARRDDADVRQVSGWAAVALGVARNFGEQYETEVATQIAEVLAPQDAYAPVALECAQRAAKGLGDKVPFQRKVQVLNLLAAAQKKVGQSAEAATTEARVTKLQLDNAVQAEKALTDDATYSDRVRVLSTLAAAQRKSGLTAETAATTARIAKLDSEQARVELERATQAEKALTESDTPDKQANVLGALLAAQRKAGLSVEADRTEVRLEKIEVELDRKFHATVPPFKPATFDGRKTASDRTVVLELFTGAECPPCVAADVAFESLGKTYKPSELVLIQYHLHIPGPDPLTSPASEARWAYYRERFPKEVPGTPTAVFNGKPLPFVGGNIAKSEEAYAKYRETVDRLVEEPSRAKLAITADRHGDTLTVRATVGQVAGPGADKRLRLVLVEESIRFLGGNRLRFHHMVVRAMPGGAEGFKLTEAASRHTVSVHLGELREELTKYLDAYAAEKRPFPRPGRPMDFQGLKAIALVQDDKTGEILQAVQCDVDGK